jgi:S-adenosylmethionine/arginine decarboxylase-like enzyme
MVNKTRKQKKQPRPWGYHLIIDAANCNPEAIRSKATITKFAKDLVKSIQMVAFGSPRVVHFGSGHTTGYTLIQLIQTSCITAHFAEDTNSIFFDCFSCKTFDPAIAKQVFQKYFAPKTMKTKFFERQP